MPSTILPLDWHPIRHVVLDFGGVLYRIDHTATANAFADLGFDDFLSLYAHSGQSRLMDDLECGNITDQEFILTLQNRCRPGTSEQQVRDAWSAVLLELRPEVLPLLDHLANRFDLLLFSNTNALHAEHFERQILQENGKGFARAFRQIIYSHRLGHRKPEQKAYREVERQFGLNPAQTLFIDDTLINVQGALKAGWTAVHHEADELPLRTLLRKLDLNGL